MEQIPPRAPRAIFASGEMADRIGALDWSGTPLGGIDSWPERLIAAVEAMLAAPQLASLAVGPHRILLYNDEASRHYESRHPGVLGLPLAEAFPHGFQKVASLYDRVFAGESLHVPAQPLDPAQTHANEVFDAYLTPVRNSEGVVVAAAMTGFAIGARLRAEAAMRVSEDRRRAALQQQIDRALAELTASRDLLRGTIDSSDDMIQVFAAIRDSAGRIVDFRWILNNATSERRFGEVRGESLLERNPGVIEEGIFDTFKRVTETGLPEKAELHYVHEQFDGWFYQSVVKLGDGVATTTKSIDIWKAAQADILRLQEEAAAAKLGESEARYRTLFDSIDQGFCVIEMIFDAASNPVDYRFLEANAAFESQTGLKDPVGKCMRALAPDHEQAWYDIYGQIAQTGRSERFERQAEALGHWYDVYAFRTGEPGEHRVGILFNDINERKRYEAELRESEERLRQFGDASQDVLWIRDAATLQWVYLTPAFETIYGMSRADALAGDAYRNWQDLIVPEDVEQVRSSIARVRGGERIAFEFRIRRPSDGTIRWLRNTDFPITDEAGDVVLIGGIGHDLTEVREAELRFQTLVEGMPQLVWRAVDGGEWTWASPQWTEFTAQQAADYRGWGWLAALHPDDRETARAAWSQALEGGGFEVEYRVRRQDGTYRWFQTRAAPVRDPAGDIVEWLGTSTDIDELRGLQELQRTLLAELQHRVRNILAVTQSIVSRSADGGRETDEYVQHLQGRISALARTQVLLTRRAGAGVDLEDLILDELLAQVASADHFALGGPDVDLSPKAAEVLTLAVHELATNATKYGAFSRPGGRLDIRWQVEDRDRQQWLVLDWTEGGVPIVDSAPRRRGFGTELLSRRVPYELKGRGRFELRPGGLYSCIEFPLVAGESILQTNGVSR